MKKVVYLILVTVIFSQFSNVFANDEVLSNTGRGLSVKRLLITSGLIALSLSDVVQAAPARCEKYWYTNLETKNGIGEFIKCEYSHHNLYVKAKGMCLGDMIESYQKIRCSGKCKGFKQTKPTCTSKRIVDQGNTIRGHDITCVYPIQGGTLNDQLTVDMMLSALYPGGDTIYHTSCSYRINGREDL
jgi:hypothetical protein